MLTIDRRDCIIGEDASTKGKEVDGEKVRTLTFELEGVMLEKRELNAFLSEPHAWDVLYNDKVDLPEPYLKCFKALELEKKIEGAYVALTYGLDANEMAFTDCTLSKIRLELCNGGLTSLSCKVTALPVLDASLAELFEQFGKSIECEIRAQPPGAQQELPLNKHGASEQPEAPKRSRKRNGAHVGAH